MNTFQKYILVAVCSFLFKELVSQTVNTPVQSVAPSTSAQLILPTNYNIGDNLNYIRTTVLSVPEQNDNNIQYTDKSKVIISTNYFDGLGRTIQNIQHFGSPTGKDLVDIVQYDNFNRQVVKFLPFAKAEPSLTDNGKFKISLSNDQSNFYKTTLGYANEQFFYSKVNYESSPLNRIEKLMPEGDAWTGNSIGQQFSEEPLTSGENIRKWNINYTPGSLPTTNGYYNTGELMVKTVIDEENNVIKEYKDKSGNVVLKKQSNTANANSLFTYYVYDDVGLLRFVISPKAYVWLSNNSWTLNSTIAKDLCFSYEYDYRLRPIIKTTPGAGASYFVYNAKDQVVFTQNEEQKIKGIWTFMKYDVLNRNIQTGIYQNSISQTALQNIINASPSSSNDDLITYLFANIYGNLNYQTTFTTAKVYITNYYDNYNFTDRTYNPNYMPLLPVGFNNTLSNSTTGLLTGTKVSIINSTVDLDELLSVNFYNDRGFIIQTQSQNHKSDWDFITYSHDFNGKLLGTITEINNPKANDNNKLTIQKEFTYDHMGRNKTVSHKINNNAAVIISTSTYDEIGRIKTKKLGNAAETLNFDYNIRNWLTGINKDYCLNATGTHFFGMEINYNNGYTQNYLNGNISGIKWRNAGKVNELRSYGYSYDNFGRLKTGDFLYKTPLNTTWNNVLKDYTESNITYDENGNILSMKNMGLDVAGQKIILDDLNYNYQSNSNKLVSVSESSASQSKTPNVYDNLGDFRDVSGNADYTYDNNGNVLSDANKSLNLVYNFVLNKPESISKNGDVVKYLYDALGNKLQKTIVASGQTTVYDYLGEATYFNNGLQLINHSEGQVKYLTSPTKAYNYNYYIKDYLGNVRTVVTEELVDLIELDPLPLNAEAVNTNSLLPVLMQDGNLKQYTATSEIQNTVLENQIFDNIDNTRALKPLTNDSTDTQSAKLSANTNMIGPDITLKVMANDKIKISTEALYLNDNNGNPSQIAENIIANFVNAYNGLPINVAAVDGSNAVQQLSTQTNDNTIANAILQMQQQNNVDPNQPFAFLNYVLLDENMNLVPEGSGSVKINTTDSWQTLETDTITIPQNGFLRVFSSNISVTDVNFDNLKIKHWQGKLVEEFNYYPYGLIFDNTQAFSTLPNNFLFNTKELQHNEFGAGNGLELYDFGARQYDAQIGRWHNIDPLAFSFVAVSPYNYCVNVPNSIIDKYGKKPEEPVMLASKKDKKNAHMTEAVANYKYKDGDGVFTVFTHGNPSALEYIDENEKFHEINTAKQFDDIMISISPAYKDAREKGKEIKIILMACQTGDDELNMPGQEPVKIETIASLISKDIPNVKAVAAPDGAVMVGRSIDFVNGYTIISNKSRVLGIQNLQHNGGFNIFKNGVKTDNKVSFKTDEFRYNNKLQFHSPTLNLKKEEK